MFRMSAVLICCIWTAVGAAAQTEPAVGAGRCGEVITVETHDRTTTRISIALGDEKAAPDARVAVVLLIGGGGGIDLDDQGCPRALSRNVLMRMRATFLREGFAVVLVDAPSDWMGADGLAGFRSAPKHADDLAKVISTVRARTNAAVWLLGHSRGSISAANAGARLAAPAAPDGLVLLSAMMIGDARAKKAFVSQTVFDLPLESIKVPTLIVGHEADNCLRSPANLMENVAARAGEIRKQVATVTGGPIKPGRMVTLAACEVGEPHDFVGQETRVGAGIVRFIRGGQF